LHILIAVRPRLFASALGRLLDRDGRKVTVVDPEAVAVFTGSYDVALVTEGVTGPIPSAAIIRLPNIEQGRPSSTVRIGSEHEIVPIASAEDLAALIDRTGLAVRGQPIA
jgi:hypothetical protein